MPSSSRIPTTPSAAAQEAAPAGPAPALLARFLHTPRRCRSGSSTCAVTALRASATNDETSRPRDVAGDGLPAPAGFVEDHVAAVGGIEHVGELGEWQHARRWRCGSAGADRLGIASAPRDPVITTTSATSLPSMGLCHDRSLIGGLDLVEDLGGPEPEARECVGAAAGSRAAAQRPSRAPGRRPPRHASPASPRSPAAFASRAARSSPNTFTTTAAVSPLIVSLMRSPRKVSTSDWMPGIRAEQRANVLDGLRFVARRCRASSSTCISLRSGPQVSSPCSARPTCCSTVVDARASRAATREIWRPTRSDLPERRAGRRRHLEHEMALAKLRRNSPPRKGSIARAATASTPAAAAVDGPGPCEDARQSARRSARASGGLDVAARSDARASGPASSETQRRRHREGDDQRGAESRADSSARAGAKKRP